MNRREFLGAILKAGIAPAIIGSGIIMPIRSIAAPEQKAIILPGTNVLHPGDIQDWFAAKTSNGHRVRIKTANQQIYVDAVLPANWWTGSTTERLAAQRQYVQKLYSERQYRAREIAIHPNGLLA